MKNIVIIMLCAFGLIASLVGYQKYSQKMVFQTIGEYQSKISVAQLDGKSPKEVIAFLDEQKIPHAPYTGIETVHNDASNTNSKQGYIASDTNTSTYVLGVPEGHLWSVKMTFTFDDHNKCVNSYVWAQAS